MIKPRKCAEKRAPAESSDVVSSPSGNRSATYTSYTKNGEAKATWTFGRQRAMGDIGRSGFSCDGPKRAMPRLSLNGLPARAGAFLSLDPGYSRLAPFAGKHPRRYTRDILARTHRRSCFSPRWVSYRRPSRVSWMMRCQLTNGWATVGNSPVGQG